MCLFPDEDDEGERNSVPLSSLSSFYTEDSLKQQKKKKNKKIKEGKLSKVMKRKKEVSWVGIIRRELRCGGLATVIFLFQYRCLEL